MIIFLIYFLICIIFTIAFKRKYGYIANPHNLFTWFWAICATIPAIFNNFGLRELHLITYIYGITFLLTFDTVSFFIPIKNNSQLIKYKVIDYSKYIKKIDVRISILELLSIALYIKYTLIAIVALLAGDAIEIRALYYAQDDTFFSRTVPEGVLSALMLVSIYLFYETKYKRYIINALFIVIIKSITSMGRWDLLLFVILNILMTMLKEHKLKMNSKPLLFGVGATVLLTIFGRGSNFFRTLVTYFSGSFAFLDYIIEHPQDYGLNRLHYGMIIFSPITEPIMYVLKVLGITKDKIPSYWLNINVQDFVDIGDRGNVLLYNNNTTTILPFLLDFDFCGIIIGASLLAILSIVFYRGYICNKPIPSLLYLWVVSGLFSTPMSYQSFMGVTPIISVFVFVFVLKCIK